MQIEDILAKPKDTWTLEESVYADYYYALHSQNGENIAPYQQLPSGRTLHNPAQKTLPSAAEMSAKLIKNATQNANDWKKGMMNPSRDPIQAARDSVEKYKNNVKKALDEDRWLKGLEGKTHADIMATVTALGDSVFSDGIKARKPKIDKAFQELQPKLQATSNAVQAMPNASESDREQRMLQNLKLMRQIGAGSK